MTKNFVFTILGKSGYGKSFFIKNSIIPKLNHYIVFDTQKEYTDFGYCIKNLNGFINLECDKIICQFEDHDEYYLLLAYISENMRNVNLIIDELGLFVSSRQDNVYLNNLILTHRHKDINIWVATQSPRFISTIILTQSRVIFCFRLKKAEIENLNKKISLLPEEMEKIESLEIGEKIVFEN